MADSEELSKKMDQLLYGLAKLSLHQKFPDPNEAFTLKDIQKEQKRLESEYINRYKDEPPLDYHPMSL
jgi:hypothetical protein